MKNIKYIYKNAEAEFTVNKEKEFYYVDITCEGETEEGVYVLKYEKNLKSFIVLQALPIIGRPQPYNKFPNITTALNFCEKLTCDCDNSWDWKVTRVK